MNINHVKEAQFQACIVQYAKLLGWTIYHTYDSRKSEPGFPDLVLARERILFRELKTEKGRLSEHQKRWREVLIEAGADYKVWRPSMKDEIYEELQ